MRKSHSAVLVVVVCFTVVLVGILVYCRIFHHYRALNQQKDGITADVYRSGQVLLVVLDGGTRLLVDLEKGAVSLQPELSRHEGFRVGRFLIVPRNQLHGIDLKTSEGFARQSVIVQDNILFLKDPRSPDSQFRVPLGQGNGNSRHTTTR
jgi:hypothetical protein